MYYSSFSWFLTQDMNCILPTICQEALLSNNKPYLNITFDVLLVWVRFSCFLDLCMRSFPTANSKIITIPCGLWQQHRFFLRTLEKAQLLIAVCVPRQIQLATQMLMNARNCITASSPALRVSSPLPIYVLLITPVSPQSNVQVQATAQTCSLLDVLLYINPNPIP